MYHVTFKTIVLNHCWVDAGSPEDAVSAVNDAIREGRLWDVIDDVYDTETSSEIEDSAEYTGEPQMPKKKKPGCMLAKSPLGKRQSCEGAILAAPGYFADGRSYTACEKHAIWYQALNPAGPQFTVAEEIDQED